MSKKKKRHQPPDPEPPPFPTNFCDIIRSSPPSAPPCLVRGLGRLLNPGIGKVKVMLKICSPIISGQTEQGRSFLTIDPHRKQVTVHDPAASGYITSANRKAAVAAPKMFAFDGIFSPDDSLTEVCAGSLSEILQSVVGGADGCLFSYGHSKLGKTFTMIGKDHSSQTLGVIPCAISWLFKLISDQKESTGARFSVRVSAVEVSGTQEILNDLLTDFSKDVEGCGSNGVYLREDPICGTQIENQSELRAPTAERAAFYFDAALAARNKTVEEDGRSSHLLFTLHVYQYRIEKVNRTGLPGVAGGRSRLHLIDLGSTSKSKDPNNASLSLSALGNVIMALLNGQRHLPHRDSKIAQLLRDSLGSTTCRTCIIVHVSSALPHHTETLQVIQVAARMHRMKRRKVKQLSSTSSEDSLTDDSSHFRRPYKGMRMGTLREDVFVSSSLSDPDSYTCTSSSEQSCDTAIYLGSSGHSLSDRDITDNEGPPRSVPRTNPRLPRRPGGSRSSGDEGSASDSGRSMTYSDHRRLMRPKMGATNQPNPYHVLESQSAPCSPQRHQYKMSPVKARQFQLQKTLSSQISYKEIEQQTTERNRKFRSRPQKQLCPNTPGINHEQWVDGPIYAEPIDIQPTMNKYTEPKNIGEQWIDGPQVFKNTLQSPKLDHCRKKMKNVVVNSEERWIDGPPEMITNDSKVKKQIHVNGVPASPSPKLKHATPEERSLKQAIIKQIGDGKIRPDSTVSVDSNTSTHAEASSSRPVSISSNDEHQVKDCVDVSENMVVKPFVRDWVEKHQIDTESNTMLVNSNNQVNGNIENVVSGHRESKLHDTLLRKLHTSASSGQSSPQNSPSASRKVKTLNPKLLKTNLSKSKEKPHSNRVTEWVKSVSNELQSESVTMIDAETNTDAQLERFSSKSSKLNVTFDSCEAEVNIIDTSYDSVDNSDCVSARDSIYEIDVENKLEDMTDFTSEKEHKKSESIYSSTSENYNSNLILEPCKLLLLRKPDGASNPNLTNDTFIESGVFSEPSMNQNVSDIICHQEKPTSTVLSGYIPETDLFSHVGTFNGSDSSISVKPVKAKPPLPHSLVKLNTVQLPANLTTNRCQSAHTTPRDICSSPEKSHNKGVSQNLSEKDVKCSKSKNVSKTNTKLPKTIQVPAFVHSSPKNVKKEKEMLLTQRIINLQMSVKKRCNDSDSGNDSGIVAIEKKLLSPYSKITKPRTSNHSSSGHGSDNSSSISTDLHSHRVCKSDKLHGGTSSGYESMLRESEASCSENDDNKYLADKKRSAVRKGGKRGRSVPSHSIEASLDSCKLSPISKVSSPYHESRLAAKLKEDQIELKTMTVKEAEKYQRKRYEEENLIIVHDDVKLESDKTTEERSSSWSFSCKFWRCFSCKSRQQEPTHV